MVSRISFDIAVALLTEFSLFFACVATDSQDATNCICRGPTKYYEELGCTPIFNNSKDCCPMRYDCDIWKKLPSDKCLVNGHIYEWGERLRERDKNPCDSCACVAGYYTSNGPVSTFQCVASSCLRPSIPDNSPCYYRANASDCCGFLYCLKKGEIRPICVVDGKTYKDGDYFVPSTEPEKRCRCGPGYEGNNVEPFCISPKHTWCNNVLHNVDRIHDHGTSPEKDCNSAFRCQNFMDRIINGINKKMNSTVHEPEDQNMMCHFGTIIMRIGDQLNQDTDLSLLV